VRKAPQKNGDIIKERFRLYRFKDGKLVERSGKRDLLKIMGQLGPIPQLE
jgi:hypothetical protein